MAHSNQGIVRDRRGEEQPADKQRAEAKHESESPRSVSREATRDPKLSNSGKTPGPGMFATTAETRRPVEGNAMEVSMTLRSELIGQASLCLAKASQEPERRQHWIDQTIDCLEKAAMAEPDPARSQETRQRPTG